MSRVPFLKPRLVSAEEITGYARRIDRARIYSNFGPLNTEFERRIRTEHFAGAGTVTTVNNATTGLMLAINAARRPGARYAVMPSFTFAATPLAAIWCGLQPYFVDIRPTDFCIDEARLTEALRELGDDVGVVVPYAAFGTAFDLSVYRSLVRDGVPVVVDAAASFGTRAPEGQFGQNFDGAVVFSFHATKPFGIGEGGLVYSADSDLADRTRQASNFGFSSARASEMLGLNGKLSEYGAAAGLATLDCFPQKVGLRQTRYEAYVAELEKRGMLARGWALQQVEGRVVRQFMGVLCPPDRDNAYYIAALDRAGIEARTYFSPACHQQAMFAAAPSAGLEQTEAVCRRILNLPFWEDMELQTISRVVHELDVA